MAVCRLFRAPNTEVLEITLGDPQGVPWVVPQRCPVGDTPGGTPGDPRETRRIVKINKNLTCTSYNVIYIIECSKQNCKKRYIGETRRMLKHRLADHRGYVSKGDTSTAIGAHFTSQGHSLSDMKISVIEQIKKSDDMYRKTREKYHIQKIFTFYEGLNKQK